MGKPSMSVSWLKAQREIAEARFASLPLPKAKDENFRYSLVGSLEFPGPRGAKSESPPALGKNPEDEALCLATSDTIHFSGSSDSLIWVPWNDLKDPQLERVQTILAASVSEESDKFAALALARSRVGSVLIVPRGVKVELPLRFAFWGNDNFSSFHNLIILEEDSSLRFVEELHSDANIGPHFVTGLNQFFVGTNASLEYTQAQSFSGVTEFFLREQFSLAQNAKLKIIPAHVGARKGQVKMEINLNGEGAVAESLGAARLRGDQQLDFWVEANHNSKDTQSDHQFFYVLNEEARAIFNGYVKIPKVATGCEASQRHRTLLLSPRASVYTMPKLEIATDQVKCAHGASVSSIMPEHLYYLGSRGISQKEAEQMIIAGFTEPVFSDLPGTLLRSRLESALQVRETIFLQ